MPTQIAALGVSKSFNDRLDRTSLPVTAGERLLITGPNGAGRSTLLRVLTGEVIRDSGSVTRRGRIGHLPQEPRPGRPHETLLAAFARGRAGDAAEHAGRLLSLGLFDRDQFAVPVGRLSTGQLQRLALARMLSEPSDVLLLDEPTNHLSPALVEDLEAALTGRHRRPRHRQPRSPATPADHAADTGVRCRFLRSSKPASPSRKE